MCISLERFHIRNKLFVRLENRGAVDNRIKRGPFLEENVDELIRDESRRYFERLIGTWVGNRGR